MRATPFRVLFLCTANSCRSILAEALLARTGGARFEALSAGVRPATRLHPHAGALLAREGFETARFTPKHWDRYSADAGAAPLDFVITVCDAAVAEAAPAWAGRPVTAHWGLPDPAAQDRPDAEQRLAVCAVYRQLRQRIEAFVALPDLSLDRMTLASQLERLDAVEA